MLVIISNFIPPDLSLFIYGSIDDTDGEFVYDGNDNDIGMVVDGEENVTWTFKMVPLTKT